MPLFIVTSPTGPAQCHVTIEADDEAQARSKAAMQASVFENPTCTVTLAEPANRAIYFAARRLVIGGYYIGPRDPNRNTHYPGKYMIAEYLDVGTTVDASRGGFCIVGDDLEALIVDAFQNFPPEARAR